MKRILQHIAILLQVCWAFMPGILFIIIGYSVFTQSIEGKDVIITTLSSRLTAAYMLISFFFWVLITWYTSRLIAYNHDKLYHTAPNGLYHTPRILGFLCFTVATIAFAVADTQLDNQNIDLWIILFNVIGYAIFYPLFEKTKKVTNRTLLLRLRNFIWITGSTAIVILIYINKKSSYLVIIPFLQLTYLFLVITRRKITESGENHMLHPRFNLLRNITSRYKSIIVWIFSDPESIKSQLERKRIFQTEKNIFFIFSLSSLVALILYTISVFTLQFARHLSTVPIVLLSFGILLGAGNILTLISIKQKINLHFLFFLALIVAGFFNDSHFVKLHPKTPDQQRLERPALRDYFSTWIKTNQILETDSTRQFIPVYFVLAEGGASRSAYWTGSVLAELEKETKGRFSQNLFCLSGASGGSIGNMVFWQSRMRSKTINLSEIQDYLSNDLLSFPLARLLGPDLILPFIPNDILNNRAEALEQSLEFPNNPSAIGSFMQGNFSSTFPDLRNQFSPPVICINCTRMEDASPALISNIRLDTAIFGNRIDVLDVIQRGKDISVASAVVLGARFPYFCPAGRIGDDYFVDGGYFDNSGVGAAHEMILDLQDLIHDSLEVNPDHKYKKIQFHVVHISNKGDALLENGRIHPLINDLAAPIKTILGSYRSLTGFSNMRLQKYLQEIYKNKNTYHIINLYNVGEQSHYPLNWTISRQSLDSINGRLQSNKAIKSLVQFIQSPN